MKTERRFHAGEVRLDERGDDESPKITGYAAVFYDGTPNTEFDMSDWFAEPTVERIMAGAFTRAIQEDDVRALFNHDPNLILGRNKAGTLRLSQDGKGLYYEVDPPDTTNGEDVIKSLRRGDVTGSSFAFIVHEDNWRKVKLDDDSPLKIREIVDVELWDVSPVTYPAYEGASSGVRHAAGVELVTRSLEQWQAGQTEDRERFLRRIDTQARMVEIALQR